MANYNSFLRYLFGPQISWTLYGLKGTGKTNAAVNLMQDAVARGFHVYTNIHFFPIEKVTHAMALGKLPKRYDGKDYLVKPNEVVVVSCLSDLLLGLCEPYKKVTILDEAGIHADSSNPLAKSSRTIKNLNKIIRHFDSSFGLITQTKGSIPPDLRERTIDVEMNVAWKGRKRILECGKRKGLRNQETGEWFVDFPIVSKFGPIPLAQYPVDGKFPSGFELDIDLKEALDMLSREESTLDIVEEGRGKEIINSLKQSPKPRRRKRK